MKVRPIKTYLGPLAIDFVKPMEETHETKITQRFIEDAVKPLQKNHPISLNSVNSRDITLPKLYLDDQLCAVGYLPFSIVVSLLDNILTQKKKLLEETIQRYEELKEQYAWWIVYGDLKFKDRRTEILVPSKNVYIGVKNLRPDIKIKREGLPNTQPVRYGIMTRYQMIYDFRDEDVLGPDKFVMTKSGVVQTW